MRDPVSAASVVFATFVTLVRGQASFRQQLGPSFGNQLGPSFGSLQEPVWQPAVRSRPSGAVPMMSSLESTGERAELGPMSAVGIQRPQFRLQRVSPRHSPTSGPLLSTRGGAILPQERPQGSLSSNGMSRSLDPAAWRAASQVIRARGGSTFQSTPSTNRNRPLRTLVSGNAVSGTRSSVARVQTAGSFRTFADPLQLSRVQNSDQSLFPGLPVTSSGGRFTSASGAFLQDRSFQPESRASEFTSGAEVGVQRPQGRSFSSTEEALRSGFRILSREAYEQLLRQQQLGLSHSQQLQLRNEQQHSQQFRQLPWPETDTKTADTVTNMVGPQNVPSATEGASPAQAMMSLNQNSPPAHASLASTPLSAFRHVRKEITVLNQPVVVSEMTAARLETNSVQTPAAESLAAERVLKVTSLAGPTQPTASASKLEPVSFSPVEGTLASALTGNKSVVITKNVSISLHVDPMLTPEPIKSLVTSEGVKGFRGAGSRNSPASGSAPPDTQKPAAMLQMSSGVMGELSSLGNGTVAAGLDAALVLANAGGSTGGSVEVQGVGVVEPKFAVASSVANTSASSDPGPLAPVLVDLESLSLSANDTLHPDAPAPANASGIAGTGHLSDMSGSASSSRTNSANILKLMNSASGLLGGTSSSDLPLVSPLLPPSSKSNHTAPVGLLGSLLASNSSEPVAYEILSLLDPDVSHLVSANLGPEVARNAGGLSQPGVNASKEGDFVHLMQRLSQQLEVLLGDRTLMSPLLSRHTATSQASRLQMSPSFHSQALLDGGLRPSLGLGAADVGDGLRPPLGLQSGDGGDVWRSSLGLRSGDVGDSFMSPVNVNASSRPSNELTPDALGAPLLGTFMGEGGLLGNTSQQSSLSPGNKVEGVFHQPLSVPNTTATTSTMTSHLDSSQLSPKQNASAGGKGLAWSTQQVDVNIFGAANVFSLTKESSNDSATTQRMLTSFANSIPHLRKDSNKVNDYSGPEVLATPPASEPEGVAAVGKHVSAEKSSSAVPADALLLMSQGWSGVGASQTSFAAQKLANVFAMLLERNPEILHLLKGFNTDNSLISTVSENVTLAASPKPIKSSSNGTQDNISQPNAVVNLFLSKSKGENNLKASDISNKTNEISSAIKNTTRWVEPVVRLSPPLATPNLAHAQSNSKTQDAHRTRTDRLEMERKIINLSTQPPKTPRNYSAGNLPDALAPSLDFVSALQPSNMSSQPSDVSLQPSNMSLQPSNMSSQPSNMSLQPNDMPLQPNNMSLQPSNMSLQPNDVSLQPSDMSFQPSNMSLQPSDVSLQPRNMSLQPNDMPLQPNNMSLQPSNMSLLPNNVSLQPSNMSLQPNDVSLQPSDMSLQPSNMSLQVSDMAVFLRNGLSQMLLSTPPALKQNATLSSPSTTLQESLSSSPVPSSVASVTTKIPQNSTNHSSPNISFVLSDPLFLNFLKTYFENKQLGKMATSTVTHQDVNRSSTEHSNSPLNTPSSAAPPQTVTTASAPVSIFEEFLHQGKSVVESLRRLFTSQSANFTFGPPVTTATVGVHLPAFLSNPTPRLTPPSSSPIPVVVNDRLPEGKPAGVTTSFTTQVLPSMADMHQPLSSAHLPLVSSAEYQALEELYYTLSYLKRREPSVLSRLRIVLQMFPLQTHKLDPGAVVHLGKEELLAAGLPVNTPLETSAVSTALNLLARVYKLPVHHVLKVVSGKHPAQIAQTAVGVAGSFSPATTGGDASRNLTQSGATTRLGGGADLSNGSSQNATAVGFPFADAVGGNGTTMMPAGRTPATTAMVGEIVEPTEAPEPGDPGFVDFYFKPGANITQDHLRMLREMTAV